MIPNKAIKKVKNDIHLEIAAGSLIAYGIFPQTAEGIQRAKETAASKDTWLAPSDLPEYYANIDDDLLKGRENDAIRAIRRTLKEFYGISSDGAETAIDTRKPSRPAVPAGIQITWFSINQVGPNIWEKLKAQLTGKGYFSEVNLSEKDADKLISNIKKSGEFPSLKDQSGIHNEVYQNWLVDTYLDDALEKTSNQTEVKKQINKKVTKRLKRSGKKISLKRRSNYYVISPKNPRKDLEDLADDILAEILDERAFEREIIEEELEQGTFRVKLPAYIKLPPTFGYMQGNKARWEPEFESDLDAAVYFVGKTPVTTNKPNQQIVADWLLNTLDIPIRELQNHRKKILEKILETINLPGVEEEYPYVYIDTVDPAFESRYAQPEEDEDEFFEDQLDDLLDEIQDEIDDEEDDIEEDPEEETQTSIEDRMNEAFDKRLDDLLNDIKKPEIPKQPKRRGRKPKRTLPKKVKNKSVRRVSSKTSQFSIPNRGQGNSLAEYFNNKIADSFSLAFQANKRNKTLGGPKRPPGFFLKKALLNRFGGDLFNRTVGSFSTDPKKYQDPSLNKGERFAATLDAAPQPKPLPKPVSKGPKQLELNFGTMSGSVSYRETSAPVYDLDTRNIVEKYNEQLKKSYNKLGIQFKSLFETKKTKNVSRAEQDSILYTLPKIFEIIRESIQNTNSTQKEIIRVKGDTLEVIKDAREFEKDSIKESKLETDNDLSSSFDYESAMKDDEEDDDIQDDEDDYEGDDGPKNPFDWFGDVFDVFDFFDFDRDKKKKRTRSRRRIKGGRPGSTIRKATEKAGKKTPGFLGRIGNKILSTGLGKNITKGLGKTGLKKLPLGLGALAGAAFSIERFMRGDIIGGIGEIASGVAAVVPGIGTAISTGIDVALMGRDIASPPTKLASGAIVNGSDKVMVGEADREAIVPLGNSEAQNIMAMMPMTTGLTIPTILGVTQQIVKKSGSGSQLEPYIEQKIAPLSKIFGIDTIAMNSKIGKGMSAVKAQSNTQEKKTGGLLDLIKGMFSKVFGRKTGSKGKNISTNSNSPVIDGTSTGQWGPLLNLISSKESGGNYEAMYPSTTLPGATTMTIAEVARRATGAVGKYQQLPQYLVGRAKAAGLNPDTDLYSPANQDLIAGKVNIGQNRGGNMWLKGQISDEEFMQKLSMEFAALPNAQGNFYYPGQRSSITPQQVKGALSQVKSTPAAPAAVAATPPGSSPALAAANGHTPITIQGSPSGQAQSPVTSNMSQLPQSIRSQVQAGATATPIMFNMFNTPVVTGYNVTKSTPGGGISTIPYDAQGNPWSPELIKRYRLGAN